MFNSGSPSSPSGVSKADLEFAKAEMTSQILNRVAIDTISGRSGWVSLGTVSLSGLNFIDLTVPSDANEIDVSLDGVSTTATSSLYARVYASTGSLLSSGYYGYLTNMSGSTLSSLAEAPGDAAILAGSLLASDYISGVVKLRRQYSSTTLRIESDLFNASTRSIRTCHVTGNAGAGITGIRLLLGTGSVTFDAGSVTTRWRQ